MGENAEKEWHRFREQRDAALAEQHGWLSLTGFHWLPEESLEHTSGGSPAAPGGLPGRWSVSGEVASLHAAEEDGLTLVETGEPVNGTVTAALADEESLMWVRFGGPGGDRVVVELARRAGRYAARVRDSASPVVTGFTGVPTFGYRPDLVVSGVFVPFARPVQVPISTAHPLVPGVQQSVGEVVFRLPGDSRENRLQVAAASAGSLNLTFHDATNGTQTAGWRSLAIPAPDSAGSVVLDFNRAVNYPSAFTPFGTCPMPVPGNRIPVPVEAGERLPAAS